MDELQKRLSRIPTKTKVMITVAGYDGPTQFRATFITYDSKTGEVQVNLYHQKKQNTYKIGDTLLDLSEGWDPS